MMLAETKFGQTCSPYTRLVHLPATRKWCFKDQESILTLGDQTYFDTRAEAVRAATLHGLAVDRYGCVKTASALVPAWIKKPG